MIRTNLFRNFILTLMVVGSLFIIGGSSVGAATLNSICNDSAVTGSNGAGSNVGSSAYCKDQAKPQATNPVLGTLNLVINILTGIAGLVAVIMIIISGLQMVSSNGNPERISHARNTILYALIGLVIVALARIIILFIMNKVSST